jgi:hypothetical protein
MGTSCRPVHVGDREVDVMKFVAAFIASVVAAYVVLVTAVGSAMWYVVKRHSQADL